MNRYRDNAVPVSHEKVADVIGEVLAAQSTLFRDQLDVAMKHMTLSLERLQAEPVVVWLTATFSAPGSMTLTPRIAVAAIECINTTTASCTVSAAGDAYAQTVAASGSLFLVTPKAELFVVTAQAVGNIYLRCYNYHAALLYR